MKISEINNEGKKILNDVFKYVLSSKDKDLWIKAGASLFNMKVNALIKAKNGGLEDYKENIKKYRFLDSAFKQFNKMFGKKFICRNTQQK